MSPMRITILCIPEYFNCICMKKRRFFCVATDDDDSGPCLSNMCDNSCLMHVMGDISIFFPHIYIRKPMSCPCMGDFDAAVIVRKYKIKCFYLPMKF